MFFKKISLICFWGTILFCFSTYSQSLESGVTLTLELLPMEKQEKLREFHEAIERYIDEHDWTGHGSEEPLTITINLQLQEASSSFEDRYSGIFMISNNSDMQYYDKYWRFPYSPETMLEHSSVYHPFTGFIDFYIYVILGGEFDKLGPMLGTPFYEKARQVADQALFDAQFSTGWKERSEFIDRLMGEENKLFRKMKDQYYLGLSYVEDDDAMVKKYCREAVDLMEKIFKKDSEHKDAINFLKAHHLEIIEIFQDEPDVLRKMIRIDPDRSDTYKKYL
ncbi:DUF4835 family protein [bacterium]|nr:DUF4835 family protein [bacterium]